MIPILYPSTATSWANNGLGHLRDCVRCEVTEERNGIYELEMQYPLSGAHYSEITDDCLLKAKANDASALQIFRVYRISKPINGIVTVYARHISYDLNGIPVTGLQISGSTAASAMGLLFARGLITHSFQAWSDVDTLSSANFTKPNSIRSILGGQQGSVLQNWGGEYEFDNYIVRLWKSRGKNTDVVIEYGKNLTDANQDRNIENTFTHVLPYAVQSSGQTETVHYLSSNDAQKLIQLPASVLGRAKAFQFDLSDKFSEGADITPQALRSAAEAWIQANKPGNPRVNITASFVNLAQTENYKAIAPMQELRLCDTVTVRYIKLGIDVKAKVIKTKYDVLAEKLISIEVGDAKSNFASTINKQQQAISDVENTVQQQTSGIGAMISSAIQAATDAITGHSGGYVVLDPPNNPYRILVLLDSDNIQTAQKVVQFNGAGIGFSETGVNGTYVTAWTFADRAFNADFIKTGSMLADRIVAGLLQSANGASWINMSNGRFSFANGALTWNGTALALTSTSNDMPYETRMEDGRIALYSKAYPPNGSPPVFQGNISAGGNGVSVNSLKPSASSFIGHGVHINAYDGSKVGSMDIRSDGMHQIEGQLSFVGTSVGTTYTYGLIDAPNGNLTLSSSIRDVIVSGAAINLKANSYIRFQRGGADRGYFDASNGNLNIDGSFYSNGYLVGSQESIKEDIAPASAVLDVINGAAIYSYDLKSDDAKGVTDKREKKRHYGFVIGKGRKTPREVLSSDGEHINLYSMISLCWKGLQELSKEVSAMRKHLENNKEELS
jgi:phage minor structural protein